MTRTLLVVGPVLGALAALLALAMGPVGVLVGAGLGLVASLLLWRVQSDRVEEVATAVNRWQGKLAHEPLRLRGGQHWERLAQSVNALGAAYARRGERVAREQPRRTQLVDAVTIPAMLFGSDNRLLVANAPADELFGAVTTDGPTAIRAVGSAPLADAIAEARERGERIELDVTHADRELACVAAPVGDEVLLLVVDRTAERRVRTLRRDFVANASHELKTPVAGIRSLAEALVLTSGEDERTARLASQIQGEAERLGNLVRDLLDLSRLEEPHPGDPRPCDLVEIVREVVARRAEVASTAGVTVTVRAPAAATVVGLREDLQRVVANLVDNAIRYNVDDGEVTVQLEPADDAWVLTVADTGVGIPAEALDRVFERFYRVDVARSRETGGTGLGLSIVRNAVRRHGGTIDVDSVVGVGTTFTVRLSADTR